MTDANFISVLYNISYYSAVLIVPPLLIATLFAFTVGLFQVASSIQEVTLSQTVKVLTLGLLLILFGGILSAPLYSASDEIFSRFHEFEN